MTAVMPSQTTAFGLSLDETHYWEWSKHLDYSYYSKGPFVAWAIALSRLAFGDTVFAVRLPAMLCASVFYLTFFLFLRKLYGSRIAFFTWLLMRLSLIFTQLGVLMTTDAPAAMCWMFALLFSWEAYQRRESSDWPWVMIGVSVGLGFWAKYTLALYIAGLFIWAWSLGQRRVWRGFVISSASFLLFCAPILLWNVQHDWVNFQHNSMHLLKKKGDNFIRIDYALELLFGQMGLLGPIALLGVVFAFIEAIENRKSLSQEARLFIFTTMPITLLILGVSLRKRVYANWPMPIYIGGLFVLAHMFAEYEDFRLRFRKWCTPAIFLNAVIFCVAMLLVSGWTFWIPGTFLPTKKLYGWSEVGGEVENHLQTLGQLSNEPPFVVSDSYGVASSIAFYAKSHPSVRLASANSRRMAQQDIWHDENSWKELKGRNAIVVLKDRSQQEYFEKRFENFLLKNVVQIQFAGSELNDFAIYFGEGFDGTPAKQPQGR